MAVCWTERKPLSNKFLKEVVAGLERLAEPFGGTKVDAGKVGEYMQQIKESLNGLSKCTRIKARLLRGELPSELANFLPGNVRFEIEAAAADARLQSELAQMRPEEPGAKNLSWHGRASKLRSSPQVESDLFRVCENCGAEDVLLDRPCYNCS